MIGRSFWKPFGALSLAFFLFGGLAVLEYCWALWCSAAYSHLRLLDRVVRRAGFLTGGVLQCNLAHRWSLSELCMLFKIKSNPMHILSCALPLLYMPARVTRGALVAHRHSFAPPRCRTSLYCRTFVSSRCFFGTILVTLYLMMWDWLVSRKQPMLFCWHDLLFLFCLLFIFFFLTWVGYVGLGSSDS